MLRQLTNSKWFALVEVILVLTSGLIWVIKPAVGGWLLLALLIPWALKTFTGVFPIQRTKFDWLLAVFLVTAAAGYWAAYDKPAAWSKLWLILGSIYLFYALSAQPKKNLRAIADIFFSIAVGISLYFFLTHNFTGDSTGAMGSWWMKVRPQTGWKDLHHAYISGSVTITGLVGFYRFIDPGEKNVGRFSILSSIAAYLVLGIIFLTFVLTMSRGIWLAISSAIALWIAWKTLGLKVFNSRGIQKSLFPVLALLYLSLLIFFVHFVLSNVESGLVTQLHFGTNSRAELFERGASLLMNFPITGGGLNSFPGLYSNYILNIPFFYFLNSYNMFLDVAIEQGLAGGLVVLFLYLASVWNTSLIVTKTKSPNIRAFSWLTLFALVVAIVHGMIYDYFYNGAGTLLLLFPIGISMIGVTQTSQEVTGQTTATLFSPRTNKWSALTALFLITSILAGLWMFDANKIQSTWYSNLGSVQLAQIELDSFPTNVWLGSAIATKLEHSEASLLSALRHDPQNITAIHRLGLIFMLRRDYDTASIYLKQAYELWPNHRGIIKSLGFCYVWLGEYDKAWFLLAQIPESRDELTVYTWWWGTQGRDDLSTKAEMMLSKFDVLSIQP